MKLKKVLPLVATSLFVVHASGLAAPGHNSLTIEMQGIQTNQGQAIFILMDSESSHRGKSPVFKRTVSAIKANSASVTFADIPTGDYSAVIYHDLNGNGELDRNFFGKPKEPYGFSNNARNPFSIPDFEESSFQASNNHSVQKIIVE